jgi:hypothetical protein
LLEEIDDIVTLHPVPQFIRRTLGQTLSSAFLFNTQDIHLPFKRPQKNLYPLQRQLNGDCNSEPTSSMALATKPIHDT